MSISNKKADLSINVIIVAVLALLVLVVLIYIFSSKINIFGQGASNCAGKCKSILDTETGTDVCQKLTAESQGKITYSHNPGATCKNPLSPSDKQVCCIGIET